MRHAAWRSVLLAAFLLLAPWSAARLQRASAELIPAATGDGSLTVHGIPLPRNAEPFLAANLTVENLRALAPDAGDLGKSGWVRAVVYNVQEVARPDVVAAYYRAEMGGVLRQRAAAPGVAGEPLADDGTRVLQLERPSRTLAVRSGDQSGPTRVTVAMYEGTGEPGAILSAVDALRKGLAGPTPRESPALLAPKIWEFEGLWKAERLELLKQNLSRSTAPEPVIDIMRSLLSQARVLSQQSYRVPRLVQAPEVLLACAQESRRSLLTPSWPCTPSRGTGGW
jgi:hypothetical protein